MKKETVRQILTNKFDHETVKIGNNPKESEVRLKVFKKASLLRRKMTETKYFEHCGHAL